MNKLLALVVLTLSLLAIIQAQERKNRPRPWEREKMQKQKDLFWFKVGDDETEACKNVDESSVQIIPGPPGDSCKEDEERFCFCGKKGSGSTNWKFICGTCYANKPFSFKIERPDDPHSLKLLGEKMKQKLNDKLGTRPKQDG